MFNSFDIGQFVKTKLAQEVQKSIINNFVSSKGVTSLSGSTSKLALGQKTSNSTGIRMGEQLTGEFIPIVYGTMGMSNTQYDEGQTPSAVDTEKTLQQVRIPVSEGPIAGLVTPSIPDYSYTNLGVNPGVNNPLVLKSVVVDEQYVIDPETDVANFKDIKFRMTRGEGNLTYGYLGQIENHNPIVSDGTDGNTINDAANDTIQSNKLNDLTDVQAPKGENFVLYWNSTAGRWEAKPFSDLLNLAGATYDGGAGGSGGTGGLGGAGGSGGTGGVGPSEGSGLKYTQWNPPPTHIETQGATNVETVITAPPAGGATVVSGVGAPLRNEEQTTPYFSTVIDFAGVDEHIDTISVNTLFPQGIYSEITTTTTAKDGGAITLCGTERPIDNSGNLNCLTPSVTVSQDGQTATTKTRVASSTTVFVVFTTELCGREFILHEGSYSISELKRAGYRHTQTFNLASMNAGYGSISTGSNVGVQQIGALDAPADCNSTDVEHFDFSNFTLADYMAAYPDQITSAANTVKVYCWLGESDCSTQPYLNSISVCDSMQVFDSQYTVGESDLREFAQFSPDHGFKWQGDTTQTETESYSLEQARCYSEIVTGAFSTVKSPDPLLVWDYSSQGQPGSTGSVGSGGEGGTSGTAGGQGSVTVPVALPTPQVESSNSVYPGSGVSSIVTLRQVSVTNSDALATNTLTITIPSYAGSLDCQSVPGSVSAIGRNTSTLSLSGNISDLQTALNSGLRFTSVSGATGDISIQFYISSSVGNSRATYTIRASAAVQPVAPTFTIIVDNFVGDFLCSVNGRAIMFPLVGATSNNATADAIASAITSFVGIPNWTASSNLNMVTVTGPVALGDSYNGSLPVGTGSMSTTITEVEGGISSSRINHPNSNLTKIANHHSFVKFGSYSNLLNDPNVAWAEVVYRPEQSAGTTSVAPIGIVIAGRRDIQEPVNSSFLTFEEWQAYNYNHPVSAIAESLDDGITFSQNAASHFLDYITNTRYGLGNEVKIDELPQIQRDAFYYDVYLAHLWCEDYKIKTNGVFFGQESKIEALQKIAAVFDGKFMYVNGYPRLIFEGACFAQDYTHTDVITGEIHYYQRPFTISKVVNQTNSAEITYSGNSMENIYNKVSVTYNDRKDLFKRKTTTLELPLNSVDYPFNFERAIELDYWGVADERLAQFRAKYLIETERTDSDTVTYIAGWDHYDVVPNQLILLNDTLRPDAPSSGGRVAGVSGTSLVLDRTTPAGLLKVTTAEGLVVDATSNGDGTATLAYSTPVIVDAVWNSYTSNENLYRVIAIEESQDGIYAVSAQKHDPNKYDRIRAWANNY